MTTTITAGQRVALSSDSTANFSTTWARVKNPKGQTGGLLMVGIACTGADPGTNTGTLALALIDHSISPPVARAVQELRFRRSTQSARSVYVGADGDWLMCAVDTSNNPIPTIFDLGGIGGQDFAWHIGITLPTGATAANLELMFPNAFKA